MRSRLILLAAILAAAAFAWPPPATAQGGKAGRKAGAKAKSGADREDLDRIRALPYVDFVEDETGEIQTGVTIAEEGAFQEGYRLYSNRGLCRADLIDAGGEVVNTWVRTPCHHWAYTHLAPDGSLLVVSLQSLEGATTEDFMERRKLLRFSWDGRLLLETGGSPHHSFDLLPDGRILALTVSPRRIPEFDAEVDVRDENIAVLSSEGKILEEQSIFDLLAGSGGVFQIKRKGSSRLKRFGAYDLIHANAVQRLPWEELEGRSPAHAPSALLLTMRHQNAVAAVDWRARTIVWAWGQDELVGPHDGTWLRNGNILIFDNGLGRRWSRVVEVDPRTDRIVWEYRAPEPRDLFTRTNGAAQRLPNGNTLISDSAKGRAFEVTPEGRVVWKFVNPRRAGDGRRSAIIKMLWLPAGYVESARAAAGATPRTPAPSAAPGAPGR